MSNGDRMAVARNRQCAAGGMSRRAVLRLLCLFAFLLLPFSAHAAVPAAPSNLAATPLSSTQIKVTWTDNSSDETSFYIEYKEASSTGGYSGVWASKDAISYPVINLKQQTLYLFRIRAYNASGYSAYAIEASTTTLSLNAPLDLAVSTSYTQATLTWRDNSNDETGFAVERFASSGGVVAADTLDI